MVICQHDIEYLCWKVQVLSISTETLGFGLVIVPAIVFVTPDMWNMVSDVWEMEHLLCISRQYNQSCAG